MDELVKIAVAPSSANNSFNPFPAASKLLLIPMSNFEPNKKLGAVFEPCLRQLTFNTGCIFIVVLVECQLLQQILNSIFFANDSSRVVVMNATKLAMSAFKNLICKLRLN